MTCIYCDCPVPERGLFCPKCTKQIKCKQCKEELILDSIICIVCGEQVGQKVIPTNINNIEYFESETERTFKASFTDIAVQGVSDSLKMILANKNGLRNFIPPLNQISNVNNEANDIVDTEVEILDDNVAKIKQNMISPESMPTLKDVKLRDLAKTEMDWVLVYSYFASNNGTSEYTRDDINEQYTLSDRKTRNRISNLSQNIKKISKSGYIKSTNDTNFILLPKGLEIVMCIFNDQSTSKAKVISKKKGQNESEKINNSKKNKNNNSNNFIDLNFAKTDIDSLVTFFKNKKPKSQNEEVLVVIKWYKEQKAKHDISLQEIKYLLKICSKVPGALEQVLINIKGEKFNWIANTNDSKVSITSIGDSYVTSSLPKS